MAWKKKKKMLTTDDQFQFLEGDQSPEVTYRQSEAGDIVDASDDDSFHYRGTTAGDILTVYNSSGSVDFGPGGDIGFFDHFAGSISLGGGSDGNIVIVTNSPDAHISGYISGRDIVMVDGELWA